MAGKKIGIFALLAGIIMLVSIVFLFQNHTTQPDLAYDTKAENIVISADMLLYPGTQTVDQPCLGQYYPRLRVWGDGLVFLDISTATAIKPAQWSGHISPTQIHSALTLLAANGFFSNFTPTRPNPAGMSLRVAAHIISRSVVYESGDLQSKIYSQLINQLKPYLKQISQTETYDLRIQNILDGISSCLEKQPVAAPG